MAERKNLKVSENNIGAYTFAKGNLLREPQVVDAQDEHGNSIKLMRFGIIAQEDQIEDKNKRPVVTNVSIRFTGEPKVELKVGDFVNVGGYIFIGSTGSKKMSGTFLQHFSWEKEKKSKPIVAEEKEKKSKPIVADVFDKTQVVKSWDLILKDQPVAKIEGKVGREDFIRTFPRKDEDNNVIGYTTTFSIMRKFPKEEVEARIKRGQKPEWRTVKVFSADPLDIREGMSVEVEGAVTIRNATIKDKETGAFITTKAFSEIAARQLTEIIYPEKELQEEKNRALLDNPYVESVSSYNNVPADHDAGQLDDPVFEEPADFEVTDYSPESQEGDEELEVDEMGTGIPF